MRALTREEGWGGIFALVPQQLNPSNFKKSKHSLVAGGRLRGAETSGNIKSSVAPRLVWWCLLIIQPGTLQGGGTSKDLRLKLINKLAGNSIWMLPFFNFFYLILAQTQGGKPTKGYKTKINKPLKVGLQWRTLSKIWLTFWFECSAS